MGHEKHRCAEYIKCKMLLLRPLEFIVEMTTYVRTQYTPPTYNINMPNYLYRRVQGLRFDSNLNLNRKNSPDN